nr:hypothetical protein [Paucilactobacillus hokkaidonensis]
MPSLEEILQSPNRSVTLREITISDLLERDELKLDITRMKKNKSKVKLSWFPVLVVRLVPKLYVN